MIKGKATIELFNAETGELERKVEDHNLVTNALRYVMNICAAEGASLDDEIFPIATNALGGILLFDGELEESVDNVHLPTNDVHLVGYADRSVNTSDIHRGSYNSAESGPTDDGYKSVWDFGTSQANGVIKAAARTSNHAAADPICKYLGLQGSLRHGGMPSTDFGPWVPVHYDGEYVYMMKASGNNQRVYRVRRNTQLMRVYDKSNITETYEQVGEVDMATYTFNYGHYSSVKTVNGYSSNNYCFDDHKGKLYFFSGGYEGESDACTQINWFTVNYGDGSWNKSEVHTFTCQAAYYGATDSYYSYVSGKGDKYYYSSKIDSGNDIRFSNGYVYLMTSNRKNILQINLSNTADQHVWKIIPDGSADYIYNMQRIAPINGGVPYTIYHYTNSDQEYRQGFLYQDGNHITHDFSSYGSYGPYGSGPSSWYNVIRCCDDKLAYFGYYDDPGSAEMITNGYIANYLGTIANLSSPIEKNASQTMKITYTLTDVKEEG